MARTGSFRDNGLQTLAARLRGLDKSSMDAFCTQCTRQLAAEVLRGAIKRTPVGVYGGTVQFTAQLPDRAVEFNTRDGRHVSFTARAQTRQVRFEANTGRQGGTLRRGWTVSAPRREADLCKADIENPVEYASYVEYGHRTADHTGWVPGRFMLTESMQEVERAAPHALEKKLERFLKEHMEST